MLHFIECINIAWKFDKKSKKVWRIRSINIFVSNPSLHWKRVSNAILEVSKGGILKSEFFMFLTKRHSNIISFRDDSISLVNNKTHKGKIRSWHGHIWDIIVTVKSEVDEILVLWLLQAECDIAFTSFKH